MEDYSTWTAEALNEEINRLNAEIKEYDADIRSTRSYLGSSTWATEAESETMPEDLGLGNLERHRSQDRKKLIALEREVKRRTKLPNYAEWDTDKLDERIAQLQAEIDSLNASINEDFQWRTEGFAFDPNIGGMSNDEIDSSMDRKKAMVAAKQRELNIVTAERNAKHLL